MYGDFDEDEDPDFDPEWQAFDDDGICADCSRLISGEDVCGAPMCFACFEMGCGV